MSSVEKYCRQVSQKLTARRSTRRQLLDGLAAEIMDALGEDCTLQEITAAFGPPERTAEELQLTVGTREKNLIRRLWKRSHVALALLCVALAAVICALVWYFSNSRVEISDRDIYKNNGGVIDETVLVSGVGGSAAALDGGLRIC